MLQTTTLRNPAEDAGARPVSPFLGRPPANVAYATPSGRMLHGKSDELLKDGSLARFEGKVNLIFTSPPFPLNRKKRYGNETGDAYIRWLCAFGPLFKKMLTPDGSIVIEMGNSWVKPRLDVTGPNRCETFRLPTIEPKRLLQSALCDRLPRLADAFRP